MPLRGEIPRRPLIAIGGNAIYPEGILGTPAEQVRVAAALGESPRPIMELDQELIITHGNGPVVGKIMLRQSLARGRVAPMSLTSASPTARVDRLPADAGIRERVAR